MVESASEILTECCPQLSEQQVEQLIKLADHIVEWNQKINLISRKDTDHMIVRHVLHSMSIAEFNEFVPGSHVLDLGTGGGFPGLPLAIAYPETRFLLIDARNKKLTAVKDVAKKLGLKNVEIRHIRVEDLTGRFDFVITRAVASIDKLWNWSKKLIDYKTQRNPMPNGLIALKGGDLSKEMSLLPRKTYYDELPIIEWYNFPFFETKKIIYIQR